MIGTLAGGMSLSWEVVLEMLGAVESRGEHQLLWPLRHSIVDLLHQGQHGLGLEWLMLLGLVSLCCYEVAAAVTGITGCATIL